MSIVDRERPDFPEVEAALQERRRRWIAENPKSVKLYGLIYIWRDQMAVATCWEEARRQMMDRMGKQAAEEDRYLPTGALPPP